MQTVFNNNTALPVPLKEPPVALVLTIPSSTYQRIAEVAAYLRMSPDDFIIVTAWRGAAILADELRREHAYKRQLEAVSAASSCQPND